MFLSRNARNDPQVTYYTIEKFWRRRLPSLNTNNQKPLKGWHINVSGLSSFVEAPLTRSDNFGAGDDPNKSSVLLVAAPGAVGKSTLARQISAATGATYIDLAEADPVGGNTLSGGLLKAGITGGWASGSSALLIDGLDEARLKVTQEGFEAFLGDVSYLSNNRAPPTILFGRTGAIQDTWLFLSDKVSVSVLEIGYYPPNIAFEFAQARLREETPENPHLETGYEALRVLLSRLGQDTKEDGDRFAGYAPVLQAIANHVARETNLSALISQVKKGEQPVTLQAVIEAILEREHLKLKNLTFEDETLPSKLYTSPEQLSRLVARVYKRPPPSLPAMSPRDAQAYSAALETWVPEHPFLDSNSKAASAVFEAVICAAALRQKSSFEVALASELAKGASANPFLAEFYFDGKDSKYIPPEHIGVIYGSLRASLSLGDSATLSIDNIESDDDLEQLKAEIEISISRAGKTQPRELNFESDQAGAIRLSSHIEDVDITAPYSDVEIGGARETVLVAPINIQCQRLKLTAERIIVEQSTNMDEGAVVLESDSADTSSVVTSPLLNGSVRLSVSWNGAEAYPWTSFRGSPSTVKDPRIDEALRRFRKFVISFRSHSKGSLKRYAAKLEHDRMTKGTGQAVLNHMLLAGVLSKEGAMYTLHPEILSLTTDASYTSAMTRVFSQKTIDFVAKAIEGH